MWPNVYSQRMGRVPGLTWPCVSLWPPWPGWRSPSGPRAQGCGGRNASVYEPSSSHRLITRQRVGNALNFFNFFFYGLLNSLWGWIFIGSHETSIMFSVHWHFCDLFFSGSQLHKKKVTTPNILICERACVQIPGLLYRNCKLVSWMLKLS